MLSENFQLWQWESLKPLLGRHHPLETFQVPEVHFKVANAEIYFRCGRTSDEFAERQLKKGLSAIREVL